MKKAQEYFYGSLDTELITTEENTYRITKGGLVDKAIEIAYLEGIIAGQADMTGEIETEYGDLNDVFNKLYDLIEK